MPTTTSPFATDAAVLKKGATQTLGVKVLIVAFRDRKWSELVLSKKRLCGADPQYEIMQRGSTADEVWLIAHFPPHHPPLTFRTLVDLSKGTIDTDHREDPFIAVS